jgi:AcrR family transcriptional regulator
MEELVVEPVTTRRVGRPRRQGVTEAILEATLALAEEQGIDELTIESIAARANISRPTLYRRWPSKDALLEDTLEVMVDRFRVDPETGNVRDDLIELFGVLIERFEGPLGQMMDLFYTVKRADLAPRTRARAKAHLRSIVSRGVDRKQLRADTDPDMITDLIMGLVWYRIRARNEELDVGDVTRIVDTVLEGWLLRDT